MRKGSGIIRRRKAKKEELQKLYNLNITGSNLEELIASKNKVEALFESIKLVGAEVSSYALFIALMGLYVNKYFINDKFDKFVLLLTFISSSVVILVFLSKIRKIQEVSKLLKTFEYLIKINEEADRKEKEKCQNIIAIREKRLNSKYRKK